MLGSMPSPCGGVPFSSSLPSSSAPPLKSDGPLCSFGPPCCNRWVSTEYNQSGYKDTGAQGRTYVYLVISSRISHDEYS